jgi:carbon-monoxide dehydrogenase catalytic subunit
MGSCVDNSRILLAATEVVKAGGLGNDISDLPAAGSAPEWMSEKAISIGHYFVASGVYTVFGVGLPVTGAPVFQKLSFRRFRKALRRYVGSGGRPRETCPEDDCPHRQ